MIISVRTIKAAVRHGEKRPGVGESPRRIARPDKGAGIDEDGGANAAERIHLSAQGVEGIAGHTSDPDESPAGEAGELGVGGRTTGEGRQREEDGGADKDRRSFQQCFHDVMVEPMFPAGDPDRPLPVG